VIFIANISSLCEQAYRSRLPRGKCVRRLRWSRLTNLAQPAKFQLRRGVSSWIFQSRPQPRGRIASHPLVTEADICARIRVLNGYCLGFLVTARH
jgi:hypothetical protein